LSGAATQASPITASGTILGTLQYMAPEQLEGQEADSRTDTFSFGAVLYEMVTGRKAFDGKSQASLIAAILHVDPPAMTTLQPVTPPALERIVATCLAKNPDDRWQSARDLLRELKWVADSATVQVRLRARHEHRPIVSRGCWHRSLGSPRSSAESWPSAIFVKHRRPCERSRGFP
jgi:serine/threonine protein kinase